MKVTKNVIDDLMPLYIAGEVSDDTKSLVDEYLKSDPEYAEVVKKMGSEFNNKNILPLNHEDNLQAFLKIKQLNTIRTIVIALIIAFVFLAILVIPFIFVKR